MNYESLHINIDINRSRNKVTDLRQSLIKGYIKYFVTSIKATVVYRFSKVINRFKENKLNPKERNKSSTGLFLDKMWVEPGFMTRKNVGLMTMLKYCQNYNLHGRNILGINARILREDKHIKR